MPEGTGMCLRCREMSAHFHISPSLWEVVVVVGGGTEVKNKERLVDSSAKYCISSVHRGARVAI